MNALLEAWVPGEEGGRAVAAVLVGDFNPAGRLPLSIPRSAGQIPVFYNHKPSGMHSNIYGDYTTEKAAPLFCFGHGLSYTQFEYNQLRIGKPVAAPGETVDISFTLTNSGERAGDEVAQLYIRDEYASLPRPVKELKGFARVPLQPGESKRVTFHLPVNQMAYYNDNLELVLEPGTFKVMVGSSSEEILLRDEFKVDGKAPEKISERVFVCPVSIQ